MRGRGAGTTETLGLGDRLRPRPVAAAAGGLSDDAAGSAAASEFLTVTPGESLTRAAEVMVEHDTSHLVVVDAQTHRAIGVISTLDLARTLAAA